MFEKLKLSQEEKNAIKPCTKHHKMFCTECRYGKILDIGHPTNDLATDINRKNGYKLKLGFNMLNENLE